MSVLDLFLAIALSCSQGEGGCMTYEGDEDDEKIISICDEYITTDNSILANAHLPYRIKLEAEDTTVILQIHECVKS